MEIKEERLIVHLIVCYTYAKSLTTYTYLSTAEACQLRADADLLTADQSTWRVDGSCQGEHRPTNGVNDINGGLATGHACSRNVGIIMKDDLGLSTPESGTPRFQQMISAS